MDSKKIVPTMIAVAILIILVAGATYAYFLPNVSKSVSQSVITGSTEAPGSVSLATNTANKTLSLAVSASDMKNTGSATTWYATASGKNTAASSPVIATATVTGAGTFNCSYKITVKATGNMYTNFQKIPTTNNRAANQLVLTVGPTAYDFNNTGLDTTLFGNNGVVVSGTLNNLTSKTAETSRQITAQLKFTKTTTDQSAMGSSTLSVTMDVTEFTCTIQ